MNKKNKILFVGPYRDLTNDGNISRNYLSFLSSKPKNKISTIPVYLHSKNRISKAEEFISEKNRLHGPYDTMIQHLPVEHMQFLSKFEYSIAFPIINNLSDIGIDNNFEILKLFNKVLVTGSSIKKALEKRNINNVEIHSPYMDQQINPNIGFNISNFPNAKKFYFIGDIDDDIEIIKQLIISFNIATLNNSHSVLVFFLTHDGVSDIGNLQKLIDDLKVNIGLKYNYINKDIFIIKSFSQEETLAMHNSCNILLSLNTHHHRIIDEMYAKACNNEIITIDKFSDITIPYYDRTHGYNFEYKKPTISTNKLVEIIKGLA